MAYDIPLLRCGQHYAGQDLSGHQYRAVKVNSSSNAIPAVAKDAIAGVLQNKPENGQSVLLEMKGITRGVFGATVASGVEVEVDADGKFIEYDSVAADGVKVGYCLEGGDADEIGTIKLY